MLDIGIEIGMEMASDPDVAGERHERRYQCARPDLYLIHPNAIGGGHAEEIEPGVCALQHYSSPRRWIGDGDRDMALIGGLAAERSEEHTSELQSLMRISYAV